MRYLLIYERFYKPPDEIVSRLNSLVDDLRIKYHGGREFFDALDKSIKHITSRDMILHLLRGNDNEWIISSGEFGDIVYQLWKDKKFQCKGVVVFNGKMNSYKIGVVRWYPDNFDFNDKKFIYVDDSLFSGSTYKKINDFLKAYNSEIKSISVIYDGSKEKNKMIKSFFRYYD